MVDLPRLGQWVQCFEDILAQSYDNREAVILKLYDAGKDGRDSTYELAAKGFSRASVLMYICTAGNKIIEDYAGEEDEKYKEDVDLFKKPLGFNFWCAREISVATAQDVYTFA